ncbi:hypothetical protein ES332_D02G006500v1 [Gossypium tomentosum]|uniref:Bulb-type lectin domain-containing protein n=1 Tax=Gossypium tomentosum TaxID=34277 RepID=A0A5D2LQU8_GOSTO|nr:hypothetical protein ES332_D02G006500v1 [Gossypium tomentosum]
MKLYLYTILILILVMINHGSCDSTIHVGHRVSLAIPLEYNDGFIGRAFLMDYGDDTKQIEPSFRVALSTEANKGKYSCSLEVFLGDVKVWNSGHYSKFYTSDVCFLELTEDGDLQLKGPKNRIGWRTGTSGQGVERLQILRTGNLVLLDVLNQIKWQSFNFPTDVMLWGQRLDVSTWLTSFPRNTSSFYTFEILYNKVALFLNSGRLKYSYWEFKPSKNRNITFVELGSKGLELFDDKHKKMAQIIASWKVQPVRFLALGNRTGNLGIYFYSPTTRKFEASFQALNTTCDLPLACKPYGICTFSNSCSCIRLLTKKNHEVSDCNQRVPSCFCGGGTTQVKMLELNDVVTVLKDAPKRINVTKTTCANLCLNDCKCVAALHSYGDYGDPSSEQCSLFQLVAGIKQVEKGLGLSYIVKVPKGTSYHHNNPSVKKWVLIVVGVVDGLIIILVLGGLVYYLVHKRRNNLQGTNNDT